MRIAIYARVSTDDKGQDPENQLRQLRQWCADAGHTIAHEYIDYESGRKNAKGRKQFAQLFEDAHKRKFDCVLFWALDRFTREGMTPTIGYLQRLAACGVSFHSYTEAHLSTDNELVGNILLAIMSSLAKVESQKIGERTRAGMARARAQGKRIGRPAIDPAIQRKIAKQLGAGLSAYAVAKQLGINAHTVAKYSPFAVDGGVKPVPIVVGQQFGQLTVIGSAEQSSSGQPRFKCQCSCGKISNPTIYDLRRGTAKSCGCSRRSAKDITGQRFALLIVLHRVGKDRYGHNLWRCRCDCGQECESTPGDLGRTKFSCGCLHREQAARRKRLEVTP